MIAIVAGIPLKRNVICVVVDDEKEGDLDLCNL